MRYWKLKDSNDKVEKVRRFIEEINATCKTLRDYAHILIIHKMMMLYKSKYVRIFIILYAQKTNQAGLKFWMISDAVTKYC